MAFDSTAPPSAVWRPYTQMRTAPPPLRMARGEGAWLIAEDGSRYLDAISSWWVTLHGHAHPRIAAAIARQARELEQVILAGCLHRPAEALAERLLPRLPHGLTRIFYSDNGSTAVEVALKMALQYWRLRGQAQRTRFIALDQAYHGDTAATMSVSAPSYFTEPFAPLLFPVERTHTAYCHRCPVGRRRESCQIQCLQRLDEILEVRGEEIAAVLVEPLLQGAGGMIVQPAEFLSGVRRACDRHGVLLIADEVLTGFGRTGTLFACEQAAISPDLICLAKGLTAGFLPMAATACSERIYEAFLSDDRRHTFFHGHSFTGNPLGCAAALASLDVFDEEPVMERIAAISRHHRARAGSLRNHAAVGDIRTLGTVAAVELAADSSNYLAAMGPKLQQFYWSRNVLLRPLGNVVYILPPYCIGADELDRVWDLIEESLALL